MAVSKTQYKCEHCKEPFTARTADRARGWARYCSKTCKARKQEALIRCFRRLQSRVNGSDNSIDYEGGGWDAHKDVF